jgi:Transmembrane secretion effector
VFPTGLLKAAQTLRSQGFRHLWTAAVLSEFGDGLSYVALAWLTLQLTGSSLALGTVLMVQAIPRAGLTLVGGATSDRFSPRVQMGISSCSRALLMGALAAIDHAGVVQLWELYPFAAGFGIVDAFFQPARASSLPSLLGTDELESANSVLNAGVHGSSILGPPLGGLVVATFSTAVAFAVDALCFAVGALALATIVMPAVVSSGTGQGEKGVPGPNSPLTARIQEGLAYVWADPRLRAMLAIDAAISFCFAGPLSVGLASLARFRFQGGAAGLGLMFGALAVGSVVGALLAGLMRRRPRIGLLIAGLAAWLAVCMAGLGFVPNPLIAAVDTFAMGAAIGFEGVFGISWIQRAIPGDLLGRIISVDMAAGFSMGTVSYLFAGAMAQVYPTALFGMIAAVLTLTCVLMLSSRRVRQMS